MCGIFGIVTRTEVNPGLFQALGERNTARGNRAFGALTFDGSRCAVTRRLGPFDPTQVDVKGAKMVLGHVRAPTDGRADDPQAVHPFETHALWLAHNGLLLNHADFAHWRIESHPNVDSTVLIGGIQRALDEGQPIMAAIQRTVEALDGQQACWLWHKPDQLIYLWRVMAPIYWQKDADRLTFSSVRSGDPGEALLSEGMIYRFDPTALTLNEIGQFRYYNPFQGAR